MTIEFIEDEHGNIGYTASSDLGDQGDLLAEEIHASMLYNLAAQAAERVRKRIDKK